MIDQDRSVYIEQERILLGDGIIEQAMVSAKDRRKGLPTVNSKISWSRPSERRRIGIGLIGHLGDIVACEPVARHLKRLFPDGDIIWVVKERYKELVDHRSSHRPRALRELSFGLDARP